VTPSDNLLHRLARVRPTVAFLVALALLLGGFFLPGIIGAALLFLLGAGLTALTFTTWPVQNTSTRVVRVVLLTLLFAVLIAKLVA
jgi:hypothetical protein